MQKKEKRRKSPWSKRKKIIVGVIIVLAVALAAMGVVYAHNIFYKPQQLFETVKEQKAEPTPEKTSETTVQEPQATPTPDPYEEMLSVADMSMMKDIVNVLVIGVDYAPERETWSGKHAYHADVMLVLAINFKENTVDMISLPRDTYAKIPGVDGIYKLNASLDCGGGLPDGFPKVCESASWMLGGIPVDYYYAVTMPAVKDIVNAMGGVDFDVDVDFTMAGRSYKKGMQYMDGQAVLDYLRVRKNVAQSGDLNRINRQKKMLVALFDNMKRSDKILKLPDIATAAIDGSYTNMSFEQIAALAVFAYNLDTENIAMHSMGGAMKNIFNWNFCLTDQKNRVNIIKEVYNAEAKPYSQYSYSYATWKWADMMSEKYLSQANKLIKKYDSVMKKDEKLPKEEPKKTEKPDRTKEPEGQPTPTVKPTPAPAQTAAPTPPPTETDSGAAKELSAAGNVELLKAKTTKKPKLRKYDEKTHKLFKEIKSLVGDLRGAKRAKNTKKMEALCGELKSKCNSFAGKMGYSGLSWSVTYQNEIKVDPR